MVSEAESTTNAEIDLPYAPALFAGAKGATIFTPDGELLSLSHADAAREIENQTVIVCHAPYTKKRLGFDAFYTLDLLELFAFVYPSRFCVPTPVGLSHALHLPAPNDIEDYPMVLPDIAVSLLHALRHDPLAERAPPTDIAAAMGMKGKGWGWTPFIFSALGQTYEPQAETFSKSTLNVWKHLPEWADEAPEAPPAHHGVSEEEAQNKLKELLNVGDRPVEPRAQQEAFTRTLSHAFTPMREDENPHIVLAEAETGTGKTLGYLAPASVWADKNEGAVWISTYTKNLQRQIHEELDRLYPHPAVKDAYVAVRKGRENYLCLLNYEDLANSVATSYSPRQPVAAGIMARWIASTSDGDLSGADFPGWLAGILGIGNTYGLSDRRGECVFSACDHYHRCFIERSVRKAKRARLVIANHALVMIQSAMATSSETMPTRYIFDEGHHLFSAADSAFSAHLTARETADLRRWIMGNEGSRGRRGRGIKRRLEDLIEGDEEAQKLLGQVIFNADILCAPNWSRRFKDKAPSGVTEEFLMEVYRVVYARASGTDLPYSLETPLFPIDGDMLAKGNALKQGLQSLLAPIDGLSKLLHQKLADDQGQMDGDTRRRLDAMASSLEHRGRMTLQSWIGMLETMEEQREVKGFVDWMEIERIDGQAIDVGLYRHHTDPMKPFASSIRPHVHGMGVTSATLRDHSDNEEHDWAVAMERSGAQYLSKEPIKSAYSSPFDYGKNTKVFIVNDVNKNDLGQVASAYHALFKASGGGALGLFTAIQRLRAVHERIALPLEYDGYPLYAQHMDDIDTGTLIDIFRDDRHACLLGTDAIRDGVDVPGDALRLLVFDRVPWPRPTILHKARRDAFGGRQYDEMMTRLKLKQAFGRLIRRADDRGVFVMLDSMLPTRLQSAFPPETEIVKTDLKSVIDGIERFLD